MTRLPHLLRPLLPACVLAAALPGCQGAPRGAGVEVRDSAGVRIVESAAPLWKPGEAWQVPAEPALRIGVAEGEEAYRFHRLSGAFRLPDGRISAADGGSHQVRIFDAAGRHLRSVGREGSGPGEFQAVDLLAVTRGDTLVAYDALQHRATLFDGAGNLARTLAVPSPEGRPAFLTGRFADGTYLLRATPAPDAEPLPGLRRDTAAYLRASAAGEVLGLVGRFPGTETFTVRQETGTAGYPLAFGRTPQVAVRGDSLFFGAGDRFELRVHDAHGALRRVIRTAHENLPVTREDVAAYRESMLASAGPPYRARLERVLSAMPFPRTMPAHGRLLVDDEGNLWAGETLRPGDTIPRWTVIRADGRWLGTVTLPPRFRLTHAGRDFLLGIHRDDEDVESLRLHRLLK